MISSDSLIPHRLAGKVALITGAASGIGLATAQRLAAEGAYVVLSDLQTEAGESAAAELRSRGSNACFIAADASNGQALEQLVSSALERCGGIDICVCSAGIGHPPTAVHELDLATYERVMRVNLQGPFLLGQLVARHMLATERRGCIVHVSSIGGHLAVPQVPAYCISKAGLDMLTKVMAVTLAPHGIRVNAVAPGATQTPLTASNHANLAAQAQMRARTPLGRYAEAEEIASVIAFLASADASYLTGQTLYADGGRTALNYTMPEI